MPVYFVVDCSTIAGGEKARNTVNGLVDHLRGDPMALETVFASVIGYSDGADQLCPLTELMEFNMPALPSGRASALGAAYRLLDQCFETELQKCTPTQKGDWKPLVFLLIGSRPTDDWVGQAGGVRSRRPAAVVVVTTGEVGADILGQIADVVVNATNIPEVPLLAFFRWVSTSLKMASKSISTELGDPLYRAPIPPSIQIIP